MTCAGLPTGVVALAARQLRWSNAGHPPPMTVTPAGEVVVLAGAEADLLLGIDPSSPRVESQRCSYAVAMPTYDDRCRTCDRGGGCCGGGCRG